MKQHHLMFNMRTINSDFIAAIHLRGNRVEYVRHTIEKPFGLIQELEHMRDDKFFSASDMLTIFKKHYRKKSTTIKYCHPDEYSSSYISPILYPQAKGSDTSSKNKKAAGDRIRDTYSSLKEGNILTKEEYEEIVGKNIEEYILEQEAERKQKLYTTCIRYIDAIEYDRVYNILKCDPSVLFRSTSRPGNDLKTVNINEHLSFSINTIFGCGKKSAIIASLVYKGNPIILYSHFLDRIKIGHTPNPMSTWADHAEADKYEEIIQQICIAVNVYLHDREKFEKSYIEDEVNGYKAQLKGFMNEPQVEMAKIYANHSGHKTASPEGEYIEYFLFEPDLVANYFKYITIIQGGFHVHSLKHRVPISESITKATGSALEYIELSALEIIPEVYADIEKLNDSIHQLEDKINALKSDLRLGRTDNDTEKKISDLETTMALKKKIRIDMESIDMAVRVIWPKTRHKSKDQ